MDMVMVNTENGESGRAPRAVSLANPEIRIITVFGFPHILYMGFWRATGTVHAVCVDSVPILMEYSNTAQGWKPNYDVPFECERRILVVPVYNNHL